VAKKKEVSVIISAKNAMAAGLSRAGAALKNFGASAARIGAAFAKSFLVAGTAIAGFATKAVMAFSVQEKAEKQAEAALAAWGDEVNNNVANIKRFAAAIQDETGIGDENTIARAAKLKMLGVEADQLEAATKATIALGKAGMGEEQAIKAVAMARNGEFTMLQRYIPALRSANSEAEKAAIVNDFLAKGYEAQKAELDTVAGRWTELKGRIGDALENIGGAIVKSTGLNQWLAKMSERVNQVGKSIANWVAGGGVERMIDTFKLFAINVRETFDQIGAYAKFGMENAWENVKWFGTAAVQVFKNAGSVIKATWENTTDQAGYYLAKLHAKMTGVEWNLQPQR
jgi:ribosomal protein L30E